jgi:hypothetical protein
MRSERRAHAAHRLMRMRERERAAGTATATDAAGLGPDADLAATTPSAAAPNETMKQKSKFFWNLTCARIINKIILSKERRELGS